jgi:hypothetical protein
VLRSRRGIEGWPLTDIAEHPLDHALAQNAAPPRADGGSVEQTGAALFPALVWAHHRWERDRNSQDRSDPELERDYLTKLREFQDEAGPLDQAYWSTQSASAVAMTVKRAASAMPDRLHLRERDDVVRIHRLTDWLTRDTPEIAELLQECDLLASRICQVLSGTSERIAMRWIFGIETHLLGFFERTSSLPNEKAEQELARAQRKNLAEVEAYYHRAASKAGRIQMMTGMVIGLGLAALACTAAGFLLWVGGLSGRDLRVPLVCYGAGALGALVSVMSRMARPEQGRFNIDFELGKTLIRRLGVYRPFVGAILGVALYFLLAGGLLDISVAKAKVPYYYGFAAFLAGFSERFATVVFGAAERRLGGSGESGKPKPTAGGESTEPG